MFKKILIGVGVMLVALMTLGASDCEVETDTPTSEAPPAAEAPAAIEAPVATEAPAAVEPEACYLDASCPLTNGWTAIDWAASVTGFVIGLEQGDTLEAEALAGCVVDVVMLRMTPTEFLGMSEDEQANFGIGIFANECYPLFEAALDSAAPQA